MNGVTSHLAAYDRQSEGRENQSVASPASQRAANEGRIKEMIRQLERDGNIGRFVGHFSEAPGTSAFGTAPRPKFEQLLDECRAGRVNVIVVMYVSRLSRLRVLDAIPIVSELHALGVTIVSVTEGVFRPGEIMDFISLIMRLDQAHNESKNKSDAIKGAKNVARELGGYTGGRAPYGFEMVPEQRVINERGDTVTIQVLRPSQKTISDELRTIMGPFTTEPDVIRWWWQEIKAHMDFPFSPQKHDIHPGSITGLAKRMERDGIPTRGATSGKKTKDSVWDPATIKRILRDPRIAGYAAEIIYRSRPDGSKSGTIDHYRIQRDPITMRPVMAYEPIIPPEEWHELQEWMDGRGRGKGLSRGQAVLTSMDILECECGSVMTSKKGPDAVKDSYRCRRRKPMAGQHEGGVDVSQAAADKYVAERIFNAIRHAEDDEDVLIMLLEATRRFGKLTEAPETAGERASLVAERADALRALEELYEDRAAGGYSGAVGRKHFLKAEAAATFRMQGAEERLAELEAASNPMLPIDQWMPADPNVDPTGPDSWWGMADVASRRAFVKLFIDRVTVHKTPPPPPGRKRAGQSTPVHQRVTVTFASLGEALDEVA
ncbi:recombinase family protein [Streptomyces virginiae]|uniref:recombinase family protein n=1 Tax=Streptomyces virginiae TaxID=1961 RepID=UPI0036A7B41D